MASPYHRLRSLVSAGAVTAAVICAACDGDPMRVTANHELHEVVTAQVAQQLDRNGRFILDSAPEVGEISSDEAKAYALAFWYQQSSSFINIMEADRGAAVHMHSLTACPRAYYVASAYSHVSANTPLRLRKLVGSQWLVGLCYGAIQEVVIAVSANATDVRLPTANAPFDKGYGNFLPMGVPFGVEVPLIPETAALYVAAQTGARVSAIPRLIAGAYPRGAIAALWHVDLASPVASTGSVSGAVRELQSFSTGHLNGWGYPLLVAGQPETSLVDELTFRTLENSTVTYTFTRRPDVPREFEEVSIRKK